MGFSNGYDSGYADAIDDVRNGKVAGLGPASGGGGAAPVPVPAPAPTYMTNAANRYVTVIEGATRVRYAAPESVTAAMNGTALDLQAPTDIPAGTVINVNLKFESRPDPDFDWSETAGVNLGVNAITVNGATLPSMQTYDMGTITGLLSFVLWYDGASWVYVTDEEAAA